MIKYFIEGGPLFMGLLSIVFLIILVITVITGRSVLQAGSINNNKLDNLLGNIRALGLFALILGMLGQFLGLFQAFDIISQGVEISPKVFTLGLKVSSITSIYGMIIFLTSYLICFLLKTIAVIKP